MNDNKAIIYGLKINDKYHYIGKTYKIKDDGIILKSDLNVVYAKNELKNIYSKNDNIIIEPILKVNNYEWYDIKLKEIVNKYKDNHPLTNAQWMLDGKRGYWDGTKGFWFNKKRDSHTLKRLEESKYVKICQYDINGYYVKTWNSIKEAAKKCVGDYKLINNSAESKLYRIIGNKKIKNKFLANNYWFRESEIFNYFGKIPQKINIDFIEKQEKLILKKTRKTAKYKIMYTVIQYDSNNKIINKFDNAFDASKFLNLHVSIIRKICNGKIKKPKYNLKYGAKKRIKINK